MKPLLIIWMALVGLVCVLLSFLSFSAHVRAGGIPMIVTPGPVVVFAVTTVFLIWPGLIMRHLRANEDMWVDAVGVMRVVMSARVSTIVGSTLAGTLISVMVMSLTQLEASMMITNAIASGSSGLAGFVWIVVVLVVER